MSNKAKENLTDRAVERVLNKIQSSADFFEFMDLISSNNIGGLLVFITGEDRDEWVKTYPKTSDLITALNDISSHPKLSSVVEL